MKPIPFEEPQKSLLPDHEEITIAKSQPEYNPLPCVRINDSDGRIITRWQLTPEERAALIAGEDIYLAILTFGHKLQPLLPTVGLKGQFDE